MHGRQPLRIGSRATKLALIQAREILGAIEREFPDTPVELREYATPPAGEAGASVAELERGLQAGEIDIAVHSAKDLPGTLGAGLTLGAVTSRLDGRDALVTRDGLEALAKLPGGAKVGTSSARRRALVLELRPDVEVVPMAGSVDERLARLEAGEVDGLLLSAAGLKRLGEERRMTCVFDDELFVPAAGQGMIALEVRQGEQGEICRALCDKASMDEFAAEREFLARCDLDCVAPAGVRAWVREREIFIKALIARSDGKVVHREGRTGPRTMAKLNGKLLAETLLAQGGKDLVAAWKKQQAAGAAAG